MNRRQFLINAPLSMLLLSVPGLALAQDDKWGVRSLADERGFRFGSAIDFNDVGDEQRAARFVSFVNSITPRNELKWMAVEKRPGSFDFRAADAIVAFAIENRMKVYGHTLIWYRVPNWVEEIKDEASLRRAMQRHIRTVMTRYKGKVDTWDVVNEPLEYDAAEMRQSVFQKLLGDDHIRVSFALAHQADPNATLVLNEAHLEKKSDTFEQRRDQILRIVEKVRNSGTPLHAVGLQAHFRPGLDEIDEQGMGKFCKNLREMDVGIYITELDASCRFVARAKGFTDKDYGTLFQRVIDVAADNGTLKGVTVWGLSEKYATPETEGATGVCSKRINLFDENDDQRSTVDGIRRAIERL